jgi:type IV protein arginine methyltransferase
LQLPQPGDSKKTSADVVEVSDVDEIIGVVGKRVAVDGVCGVGRHRQAKMTNERPTVDASALSDVRDIVRAAGNHDLDHLQRLLDSLHFEGCKPVDVQEPEHGYTPLHAAIASCRNDGATDGVLQDNESKAYETVKLLFENGAIWNQLDRNDETPGCIAHRLGLTSLYQLMVDAGVRAELLLNRLDGYEELENEDDEGDLTEAVAQDESDTEAPELVVTTAEGEIASVQQSSQETSTEDVGSTAYLSSALSFDDEKLLDESQNGVMMKWESDIMARSAKALLSSPGLKILNIGFGMGIIDTHIQSHANKPAEHHIVEAHPDVLRDLKSKGWQDKPNVFIHDGKWQDVLPGLVAEGQTFDAIYYDTFAESYHDFKEFFSEQLIGLLEQGGKWSYFNGMGADRQISYDVYQKIVEIDLMEAGFDVEWTDIDLPDLGAAWTGVKRKYWNVEQYRLPVCKFMD